MSIPSHLAPIFDSLYQTMGTNNYGRFVDQVNGFSQRGEITLVQAEEILEMYPNPRPLTAPQWDEEEGTESFLKDPPDVGPLVKNVPIRRWVKDIEEDLKWSVESLRETLEIDDEEVVSDIQDNTLRILDGCNDPRKEGDWGTRNHQGLVYGMVQSGKTASMISLVRQAHKAGYRLFVVLSGDKTSLRDQTQERFSRALKLDAGGANKKTMVYSPTMERDFKHTAGGYSQNFLDFKRVAGEDWTILIVMKKRTEHLNHLIEQIKSLEYEMRSRGDSMADKLPAMIIDDEADYASRDTTSDSEEPSTINKDIVALREAIPRNCYIAYTATPQACLFASPNDPIGYPRDFWWLLEPYMDFIDEQYVPRSYVGPMQVFHQETEYLLHRMGDDEWPHHKKGQKGSEGIYTPSMEEGAESTMSEGGLFDLETAFLDQIERGDREPPPTIQNALLDYMITCGIRWWRTWRKKFSEEKPSRAEIERDSRYKHHAMMVHMTLIRENQEKIRGLIEREWPNAVEAFHGFEPKESPDDDPFRQRWRLQRERTWRFKRTDALPFDQIRYFIEKCIEITQEPIMNHRIMPYSCYHGEPWIYLLNSEKDVGMELNYSQKADREIRTKKAGIVVGGNILSRGLTIQGLSVTIFCRSQENSMGDTNLQMGRWFGHKRQDIDLLCVHMQDSSREMFRQIAEADRYLGLQIKIALREGHSPLRVLVELRNSPWFRATSNSKSHHARMTKGAGFAGKTASLKQPDFDQDRIHYNQKHLDDFFEKHHRYSRRAFNRADLLEGLEVEEAIRLLKGFKCKSGALPVTFKMYAEYLQDWLDRARDGEFPYPPYVNIARFNPAQRSRAQSVTNYPRSAKQAKHEAAEGFRSIYGGVSDDEKYKGDAHIDRGIEWHEDAESGQTKVRQPDEPILIAFYQLDPNYIRKTLYNWDLRDDDNPNGLRYNEDVRLQPGDTGHIYGNANAICYYAWTPLSGPMYGVGVNSMIDVSKVLQIGTEQVIREEE